MDKVRLDQRNLFSYSPTAVALLAVTGSVTLVW